MSERKDTSNSYGNIQERKTLRAVQGGESVWLSVNQFWLVVVRAGGSVMKLSSVSFRSCSRDSSSQRDLERVNVFSSKPPRGQLDLANKLHLQYAALNTRFSYASATKCWDCRHAPPCPPVLFNFTSTLWPANFECWQSQHGCIGWHWGWVLRRSTHCFIYKQSLTRRQTDAPVGQTPLTQGPISRRVVRALYLGAISPGTALLEDRSSAPRKWQQMYAFWPFTF